MLRISVFLKIFNLHRKDRISRNFSRDLYFKVYLSVERAKFRLNSNFDNFEHCLRPSPELLVADSFLAG